MKTYSELTLYERMNTPIGQLLALRRLDPNVNSWFKIHPKYILLVYVLGVIFGALMK